MNINMKFNSKYITLFLIICTLLFCVSGVCAHDTNTLNTTNNNIEWNNDIQISTFDEMMKINISNINITDVGDSNELNTNILHQLYNTSEQVIMVDEKIICLKEKPQSKENATIYSSVYQTSDKNIVAISIPFATGTVNASINGKEMVLNLVDCVAICEINSTDVITEVNVTYNGNDRLNGANSSIFRKLNNTVNNDNYMYYFNQQDNGKIFAFIDGGVTLDFQGYIGGSNINFDINKPINIISSTNDAVIDLNTSAGSLSGSNVGCCFAITHGGSWSNITGIKFHNTQLWIYNTSHVTLDRISNIIEDQRVGSGVGATSIRQNSTWITIKNSYFHTKNNGGSSTLVLAWASHCTLDNNTVYGEGNVGNLIYATLYNVEFPKGIKINEWKMNANCYNNITNNRVYGPKVSSAICDAINIGGSHFLLVNNTCVYTGVGMLSGRYSTLINNIVIGTSISLSSSSVGYNNNGSIEVGQNCTAYNNTANSINIVGANAKVYNNILNGNMVLTSSVNNATISGNYIDGILTLDGANKNIIINNTINSTKNFTIDLKNSKNNLFENNTLYSKILSGDASIKKCSDYNIFKSNYPWNNNITIFAQDIHYGEDLNVEITLSNNITDTVMVLYNGQIYFVNVVNGSGKISFSKVPIGQYVLTAIYKGTNDFGTVNASTVINCLSYHTKLNITMVKHESDHYMNIKVHLTVMNITRGYIVGGEILLIFDGEEYTSKLQHFNNDIYAVFTVPKITEGRHTIIAIYTGGTNEEYRGIKGCKLDSSVAYKYFNLEKITPLVNSTSLNLSVGESYSIDAILNLSEVGNLTFTSNDTNVASVDVNGKITAKTKGIAIITLSVGGDGVYALNSTTVCVTVHEKPILPKENLTISASADPLTVGENATINVTGLKDATGNVTVTINNKNYTTITNGKATITVSNLTAGNFIANVTYTGDNNYNPSSTTVNITVNHVPEPIKKNLTLNVTTDSITVGEDATINVTGLENATGNITAKIKNNIYHAPIVNGTATFTVSNLTSNTTIYIFYEGDDNYNPVNTTVDIIVYPKSDVIIVAKNITKYYGGPESFIVKIYNSKNKKPITNKTVKITINGITYNKTTDTNGIASLAIRLINGTYNVTTTVDNTTVKSNVTVLSTIIGLDITKYYKNQTQYSVKVYDTKGKPVGKNEIVTFNVKSIFYKRTTDEKGIATLNINLPPSDYIITADYKGSKISNKIKVLPVLNAKDIIMNYLDGTQFKANLVDGQGKPYKNQMITFNINGIFYNRLTDSNGQATLNIRLPAGEYIITSSFNGANIANKITITG